MTALDWRRAACVSAGLTDSVERLRFEWTPPGSALRPNRLALTPEPDDEVFVDLFVRVLTGTLDAATSHDAAVQGAERSAREYVDFYRDVMRGERSWWRVAHDENGALVGFALPSANADGPVVGYPGVLPEHRGHGYVDDLLAGITGFLAARGAERIRADTDLGNTPMAAAFDRAGYARTSVRLVLSAP